MTTYHRVYNMVAVAPGLATLENFRVNADLDGCGHGITIIARGARAVDQPWYMAVGASFEGMKMPCQQCGRNCLSEEGGDAFIVLPDCRRNYSLDCRVNDEGGEFQHHILAETQGASLYRPGPPARFSEARVSCMNCVNTNTGDLVAAYYQTGTLFPRLARDLAEGA